VESNLALNSSIIPISSRDYTPNLRKNLGKLLVLLPQVDEDGAVSRRVIFVVRPPERNPALDKAEARIPESSKPFGIGGVVDADDDLIGRA